MTLETRAPFSVLSSLPVPTNHRRLSPQLCQTNSGPLLFGVLQAGVTALHWAPHPGGRHGGGLLWAEELGEQGARDGCQGPVCHLCFPRWPSSVCTMTMCLWATALLPSLSPHSSWEEGSSLLDLSDPEAAGAPFPVCAGGLSQSPAATQDPVPSSPPFSALALGSQANCGLLFLSSVLESEQTRALAVDLLCDLGKGFNHSEPRSTSLQNGRCRLCGENPQRWPQRAWCPRTSWELCCSQVACPYPRADDPQTHTSQ